MGKIQQKRMLLIGPGFGHNTKARLDSLSETADFDVTFLSEKTDNNFIEKYPNIHFVPVNLTVSKRYPFRSLKTIWTIIKYIRFNGYFDVVYSLGDGGILVALFFLLARKKTIKALEIWSVRIIGTASNNKSLAEKLDRYVIKKADLICQYWWGIRELFISKFPQYENKFLMYQLSYPDIYFSDEKHVPETEFVKRFLERIPKSQKMCFWPRSFIPANNHKVMLKAMGIVKKENPEAIANFKLYLWGGNVADKESVNIIHQTITDCSLDNYVEIIEHPFVPQNDIFAIEERTDFFVQLANNDILSSFIMEILCSGKPFIMSNLRTFQFLNEKYNLNIELVDNEPRTIAEKLTDILIGKYYPQDVYLQRKELCKKHFSKSMAKPWTKILAEKIELLHIEY